MPDEFRKAQITGKDDPRAAIREQTQQAAQHNEDADLEAVETWEQEVNTREQENLENMHRKETTEEPMNYTTETPVDEEN